MVPFEEDGKIAKYLSYLPRWGYMGPKEWYER